jgi:peptidoglycan/LPS O-acetylase OafA/YrhL
MNEPKQHSIAYLKPLDGIRAISIIAVLIFHISPSALRGGFTGVDVFFVISGFLITSIILNDLREGCFSLREFYLRRFQRLLPNAIATVLGTLVLWSFFFPASTARATGSHALWTLVNASNLYVWRNLGGYWGDSAEWFPLTHTWSLGIEEQFYLLFPGTLLLLIRLRPGRLKLWLAVATALSFGACLYGSYARPSATFHLLPTRVWELLLGALLATHRTSLHGKGPAAGPPWTKARTPVGWVGIILVFSGFVAIGERATFPGWVSLGPTVGATLLLWSVADGETALSRWLSSRFMVRTGKLSYSLYLWHWPLITFGKIEAVLHGLPKLAGAMAGGAAGIILAWAAYEYVEQPLRHRGAGRRGRIATIAAGFALVALFAGCLAARPRVADPQHVFNTPASSMRTFEVGRDRDYRDWLSSVALYDVYAPPVPAQPVDCWRTGGIVHLYGGGKPQVVVLGSSQALMYSKLIDDICHDLGVSVAFLASANDSTVFFESHVSGSFPSPQLAHEFDEARRRFLREWQPELVVAIDRWDGRATGADGFEAKLRPFLSEVAPLAGRILFVSQVPAHRVGNIANLREMVTAQMSGGRGLPRLFPDSLDELRRQIATRAESLTADFKNLRVLRADIPFYKEDGSIRYAEGRDFYYIDGNHLSDGGSEVLRDLFQRAISDAHSGAASR